MQDQLGALENAKRLLQLEVRQLREQAEQLAAEKKQALEEAQRKYNALQKEHNEVHAKVQQLQKSVHWHGVLHLGNPQHQREGCRSSFRFCDRIQAMSTNKLNTVFRLTL